MTVSDHLFNAIGPALKAAKVWAPLTDRMKIAEAIEAYLNEHDVQLCDAGRRHSIACRAELLPADQSGETP